MGNEGTRLFLGARHCVLHPTYVRVAEDTDGQKPFTYVMGCVVVVVCGGEQLMLPDA
jgi:hypothetical protein